MAEKNYAEMFMAIFEHNDPGGILWQPRLEFWYAVNKKRGTLPEHLKGATLLEVYDYCHASVRYFVSPLRHRFQNVEIKDRWLDDKSLLRTYETQAGILREVYHYDEWGLSAYQHEYRLKTPQDFIIYETMLENEIWEWDQQAYEQNLSEFGNYGVPQFYFRRTPIQGLFIENMGFESTIFMMNDQPQVIERYVEAASQADDALYEVLCASPIKVLNFGENIDAHMDPPSIWRNHLLPYYQKRANQLMQAGKHLHIHIDGAMRPLIREIRASPFEAIEACTPLPQGDVTLDEMKQALGDRILLDGIPAIYFLPSFPMQELLDCTRAIVELFHPRLVLGISDEPPPDSDIERVRIVGEYIQSLQ
jgi:hypothetical protein